MTARTLAIEALKGMYEVYGGSTPSDPKCSVLMELDTKCRDAIAAIEAETGEPVAWIDPRDLAVLTCPDVEEFGARRFAGVSGRTSGKNTFPLYTAPPPAVPQWLPIESAPRGSGENGPRDTTHPDYVKPPNLLLFTEEGPTVGYYDWYYHEGYGRGAEPGQPAWRGAMNGEPVYGVTHFMPLPSAPGAPA